LAREISGVLQETSFEKHFGKQTNSITNCSKDHILPEDASANTAPIMGASSSFTPNISPAHSIDLAITLHPLYPQTTTETLSLRPKPTTAPARTVSRRSAQAQRIHHAASYWFVGCQEGHVGRL
jgi:hypothetical protein